MAIILQIGLFDQSAYPEVLQGISERLHAPAIEYVFVDDMTQARELKRRIADHIPAEDQPSIYTIPAGSLNAKEAFTALLSQSR